MSHDDGKDGKSPEYIYIGQTFGSGLEFQWIPLRAASGISPVGVCGLYGYQERRGLLPELHGAIVSRFLFHGWGRTLFEVYA